MDYKALYDTNADFRDYVDKYCAHHSEGKGISLEEALEHRIVRNYAKAIESECSDESNNGGR